MEHTFRLQLTGAVALQGTPRGVWVADRGSQSVVCFHAEQGNELARIALHEAPVALAAADGFLAVGFDSGVIAAFDMSNGKELWRRAVGSSDMVLRSAPEHVWAAERQGASLLWFDRSGTGNRIPAEGLHVFAPTKEQVFWLSREGILVAHHIWDRSFHTAPLANAEDIGSMAACANALWFSVSKGLLLVDQRSLTARTSLGSTEGPVPHLMCEDNKLIGGGNRVFVLNPMADARVHELAINPGSPLHAIAATPSKVWVLESAQPIVHIADLI